jgi:putative DNA-invertase from lambdoid prophage Rac
VLLEKAVVRGNGEIGVDNMTMYGYVRYALRQTEKLAQGQIAEMARKAEELGGNLAKVFVDPDSADPKTAVLSRPAGKEMLEILQAGDTLIVNRLDRLGHSMRDVCKTVGALCELGVRIYVLHALDGELDLAPAVGKTILQLFTLWAKTERSLRSERATELAQWRKQNGLAYGGVPTAKKIVERNGAKVLEWDMEQLGYIAEIAKRLPTEGPANVAADFRKRRVKDRRGRPWGQQTPRSKPQSLAIFETLAKGRRSYDTPYQQFHRAALWFHRMKRKGLLPPPYGDLALLMQEPKRFREEPKPKKWTPGGTAQRERERAASKARHRAERLARWQQEKAARVESRVHKPRT